MLTKIKNIVYLIFFFIFIVLIIKFYFSEENIKFTNKLRSTYSTAQNNIESIPILKNDTVNSIEYTNDIEMYEKRKKKYKFFDLIKN